MDTTNKYFRVRRKDIAYFKFIVESYEGMAVVRTKDPSEAIVELMIARGGKGMRKRCWTASGRRCRLNRSVSARQLQKVVSSFVPFGTRSSSQPFLVEENDEAVSLLLKARVLKRVKLVIMGSSIVSIEEFFRRKA